MRQVGCVVSVILTDSEYRQLVALPFVADEVYCHQWCELEPCHEGAHYALGQLSGEDAWWLRWDDAGLRELVVLDVCWCEENPGEDSQLCTLPTGHTGGHGWEFDIGMPSTVEGIAEPMLVPHQRHNRALLDQCGLTVDTYLLLTQLRLHEQVFGRVSRKHLAQVTTDAEVQLIRVGHDMRGLDQAVSRGYLRIVANPPYQPLYGGDTTATVVVSITDAGRWAIEGVDDHLVDVEE